MRKLEEKFRENTTLKYYNENATIFSATTQIVDFSITQDKFLALFAESRHAKALPFRSFQVKTLYMLCTVLAIMRIAFH